MRPQDIVILLKILCYGSKTWDSSDLANDLFLSTDEVSSSLERNAISGLIDYEKKKVRTQGLLEFLLYGIKYVFPERPGGISRGIPTGHSHPFMQNQIVSDQPYVWPDAESDVIGLSVCPLYSGVVNAVKKDEKLYLMLALIDVLRLGKAREKNIAIKELERLLIA